MPAALVLEGVGKLFPPDVRAVEDVHLELESGEIHALCGENGAGKTTLAQIAAGKLAPSEGAVRATGAVGIVHQHFELVERLRVWENVVLGREPAAGGRLDARAARQRVRELSEAFGLAVDPDAIVEDLPVGIAQRVELLRELSREPSVLILDEPTAVLAPAEIDALFATLHALAARGTAILVITHKLQEVVAHAQRVTVMRAGRVVARYDDAARTGVDEIARAMVGGALPTITGRAQTAVAPCFVAAAVRAGSGAHELHEVSFAVGAGEIVAVAGVEGNGQSALADAIAGVLAYDGSMELGGAPLAPGNPGERIARGLRTIPQDRRREALVLRWAIPENAALGDHARPPLRRGATIDRAAVRTLAQSIVERFDVRAPSLDTAVSSLSGGNQQKIVVGRALAHAPRFVLAYQPTRGIDVGAAALVQSRLIEARNAGAAVLLVSLELDEVLALADRILVFYRGAIAGTFERDAFDRARIGALMAGAA
jgi:simple sugar transport system ATP-binding protein